MQLLALSGKLLGSIDPLLLRLNELQFRRRSLLKQLLDCFRKFFPHGHRRFKSSDIFFRLAERGLSLVD